MLALLVSSLLAADGPAVTVVSVDDAAAAQRAVATGGLPVTLVPASAPADATPSAPLGDDLVGPARKAWVGADFAKCLSVLADDAPVRGALASDDRLLASRLLAWRVACKVSARQPDAARRDVEWFAALELPLPADVGVMTPEIETFLTATRRAAEAQPRRAVTVTSPVKQVVVSLDGRPGACIAPCVMQLLPGVHVAKLSADGYSPVVAPVSVAGEAVTVELSLQPADPALASAQWQAKRASGEVFDSGVSVKLLSVALRAARLIVVGPAELPGVTRGALAVDGVVQARGERDDVQELVRDLLVRGKVVEPSVPLWKRWPFWVAVGAAAIATGVTTGVLLANRPVTTRVVLNP